MIRLSSYVEFYYDKGITKQYKGDYTMINHYIIRGKYKLSKRKWSVDGINTIEGANRQKSKSMGNHSLTYLQIII